MKTVTVACTPEEALRYFTADFGVWWPAATHSVVAYASEFKDKPAKNIFWGKVLAWQPPARLLFSFHPGRDAGEAQTVEV